MPTLAVFDDFLRAFAGLPRAAQRKVRDLHRRLAGQSGTPLAELVRPAGGRDPHVRVAAAGPDCQVVLLHPDASDLYVWLWVGPPAEALEWACQRTFSVHPATGSLQVFDMQRLSSYLRDLRDAADSPLAAKLPGRAPKPLFAGRSTEELMAVGVPEVLLPAVRALRDLPELWELCFHLPAEAAEALTKLASGAGAEEVLAQAPPLPDVPPAPDDLESALARPDTRRRFAVVRGPSELEAVLEAPLARWRLFLHPSQQQLALGPQPGPALVLGGAGTGKTVVAMHRARHLAREVFPGPGDRILFTTYTVNLAQNLRDLMQGFCGEEMARIDVVHLHAWAQHYARAHALGLQVADDAQTRDSWDEALAAESRPVPWDRAFFESEWRHVVLAGEVSSLKGYLQARRGGRGSPLSREAREVVWRVMERHVERLAARGLVEWPELLRAVRRHVEGREGAPLYRAAVIDESQDFGPDELRLLRALVPPGQDDLFLAGDSHQRIYGRPVVLSKLGIDVRRRIFRLKLNYRTTEQIRHWAVDVLEGEPMDDLDGGGDDQLGYVSLLHGVPPEVRVFPGAAAEQQFLAGLLPELLRDHAPESVCLVARSKAALTAVCEPALRDARVAFVRLERQSDGEAGPGVRVATMHRVKGLEFACVVVAGLTADEIPFRPPRYLWLDEQDRAEHDRQERCLLFVAATRARDRLLLTAGGPPSPFLREVG
jgi:superfamily I DNA/RNA helicase